VTLRPRLALVSGLAAAATLLAGCGGGGSGGGGSAAPTITIQPARIYHLSGFTPTRVACAGAPTRVSFTIVTPQGKPLTQYRQGTGPHNGVHLIFVRRDLGAIVHRHPPIGTDGKITDTITFPMPGPYRLVIDAYPQTSGPQRNFQLFESLRVAGPYKPVALPPFSQTDQVGGYRFTLHGTPHLKAISPAFLHFTVDTMDGLPAHFETWYGALAHAIFFRQGTLDYFHTHVCAPGASGCASILGGATVTGSSATPGRLNVGVLVPVGGTWRLFLQTKIGGKIVTAPFTLHVAS
jgi:hypothetical protein